jgi:hypothetical protein
VPTAKPDLIEEMTKRWEPKVEEGSVVVWRKLADQLLVAYSAPPAQGGTVVGVLGQFGQGGPNAKVTEFIRLPGKDKDTKTGDDQSIEISATDLTMAYLTNVSAADAKYKDKTVKVSGDVKSNGNGTLVLAGAVEPKTNRPSQVTVQFPPNQMASVSGIKPKDHVTIVGKVAQFNPQVRDVSITNPKLEK